VTSWVSEPVDHLLQRLQLLDEQGKGLFAMCGKTSPVSACVQSMTVMLAASFEGSGLAPLFWRYERHDYYPEMPDLVRRLALGVMSQVWWRCLCYKQYPFSLVRMVDSVHDAAEEASLFYDRTPRCCLDEAFSRKIFEMFPD
jgi:hypothetical protein